ncbi:MAG TPA: peroxiredoxin-like family protein [Chitinophagaceae bacterium]|nr:peroxiredoxin-like family protein [Chitinophagaceae bacterium]
MKKLIFTILILISFILSNAQTKPAGLKVGDKAPEFTAKDQNDKVISLKDALKNGKVVLIFYRGQWCPYCNKQLKGIEDSLSLLTSKGASVLAITPEQPASVGKTIEKTKATYSILTDDNLKIMKEYDVAYAVDPATVEKYKSYGIDFSLANGNNGANLPVPAVYIIDTKGNITYRYFDADYTKRASIQEIVDHL